MIRPIQSNEELEASRKCPGKILFNWKWILEKADNDRDARYLSRFFEEYKIQIPQSYGFLKIYDFLCESDAPDEYFVALSDLRRIWYNEKSQKKLSNN